MGALTKPIRKVTHVALVILCVAAYQGCTTINHDYPRKESTVFQDTGDTQFGKSLSGIEEAKPADYSGFYPLENGVDALASRLILADRAERSIDLQYYLIKDDMVGKEFMRALLRAADRGVRIRLLLDDIFTHGLDKEIVAFDSHPNIQIRIFNPFNRGVAGRIVSSTTSFNRVNRRMHNKSFTVDNQITVIGGRNIADEYFAARKDVNFQDLDVVGVGPVVQDVSNMFDSYWKHETAIPVLGFMKEPKDVDAELGRVRTVLEDSYRQIVTSQYVEAIKNQVLAFIDTDKTLFFWAPYELVFDSPDKGIKSRSKNAASIIGSLTNALSSAEKEIYLISPYVVLQRTDVQALAEAQSRNVQVKVLTNSMAANNHLTVHSGYAPSRKPLLQHGVKIYEVRPDAEVAGSEIFAASGAKATLHTKAFIIDRKELFIGSFNFDPRSAFINTEMGVIIRHPEMAEYFAGKVDAALPNQTYEVFLNNEEKLRWRGWENGKQVIYQKEPQTSWSQRFKKSILGLLPIKAQL
jgi:cardiolipin synthase C